MCKLFRDGSLMSDHEINISRIAADFYLTLYRSAHFGEQQGSLPFTVTLQLYGKSSLFRRDGIIRHMIRRIAVDLEDRADQFRQIHFHRQSSLLF